VSRASTVGILALGTRAGLGLQKKRRSSLRRNALANVA
jgi:hypothetical protein